MNFMIINFFVIVMLLDIMNWKTNLAKLIKEKDYSWCTYILLAIIKKNSFENLLK